MVGTSLRAQLDICVFITSLAMAWISSRLIGEQSLVDVLLYFI